MTRREEIEQQAEMFRQPYRDGGYRLSSKDVRDAFEEGAEWADKTMIKKACSILEDMTEGKLGKRFINEFKNKLTYGVLERH